MVIDIMTADVFPFCRKTKMKRKMKRKKMKKMKMKREKMMRLS